MRQTEKQEKQMKQTGGTIRSVLYRCVAVLLSIGMIAAYMQISQVSAQAESKYTYTIHVNRVTNIMKITRVNSHGQTVVEKIFACSTGRKGFETPPGNYKTFGYYEWKKMVGDVWARYAVTFSTKGKGLLIHSVPYYEKDMSTLEYAEYNKLGSAASSGCIRLSVADAKWVYDNCKNGTVVHVYEDPNEKTQMPITLKLPKNSKYRGWDPSGTFDKGNPWVQTLPTTMECSVWSAPNTNEENRVKVIPKGYPVQIIRIEVPSTRGDNKVFYRTVKGNYILAKCFQ